MSPLDPRHALRQALEQAAHLLPAQAPLHAFVHHNTLHAFEHLPFEQALEQAASVLGAEPYPTERLFAQLMRSGSLEQADIDAQVDAELSTEQPGDRLGDLHFSSFAKLRIGTWIEVPTEPSTVRFLKEEEFLFTSVHELAGRARQDNLLRLARLRYRRSNEPLSLLLRDLWSTLEKAAPMHPPSEPKLGPRRRDQLLALTGIDIDSLTHPLMIKLSAAFIDQGIAYWEMPGRERGFFHAAAQVLTQPSGLLDPWQAELRDALLEILTQDFDPEATCILALEQLQVPVSDWTQYVTNLLLSLRGWAGMMHQLEVRPDKSPLRPVRASLVEFTAILLLLEVSATRHTLSQFRGQLPDATEPSQLEELVKRRSVSKGEGQPSRDVALVYEAFVMAQVAPLDPELLLEPGNARTWLRWHGQLPPLRRRRLLLGATERHYFEGLTAGLLVHLRWLEARQAPEPLYQAVFCIDDREESLRRHLEETDPQCETFSYPGFFGIAMHFSGAGEVRPQDLCPVVMSPTHAVREVARITTAESSWQSRSFDLHVGSRTLFRGLAVSALGWLSLFPLVLGVLFPRWFHLKKKKPEARATRLEYEARTDSPVVPEGPRPEPDNRTSPLCGYRPEEMASIVESFLREMGLVRNWTPLVLVVGHGSSSINNPHRSAYGCGATGGGCGGPNARVLAAMANRRDVRDMLQRRGLAIPGGTRFIGGVHDTCTDDVTLDDGDVDDLSDPARAALHQAKTSLARATEQNALERCRLFGRVDLQISPAKAKAIVEARSVDLSEPRPEYNHAKNACAIVGRRRFTRGLFLDQRAFLVSYDPTSDPEGKILLKIILGSVPVGMGINLEYFFSQIDQRSYGAGSKLPHNVSGLVGVMDGHSSDLRTGLYAQMVELHEPLRLVVVVDAAPAVLEKLLVEQPMLRQLVENAWLHLLAFQPEDQALFRFQSGCFVRCAAPTDPLPEAATSLDWFKGRREALPPAHVLASFRSVPLTGTPLTGTPPPSAGGNP